MGTYDYHNPYPVSGRCSTRQTGSLASLPVYLYSKTLSLDLLWSCSGGVDELDRQYHCSSSFMPSIELLLDPGRELLQY
jgi:hypothetical protein